MNKFIFIEILDKGYLATENNERKAIPSREALLTEIEEEINQAISLETLKHCSNFSIKVEINYDIPTPSKE